MNTHCPNKNQPEYKKMVELVGEDAATRVWYENVGNPIWLTNSGVDSPLWSSLLSRPSIQSEKQAATIMAYAFTKEFKAYKEKETLNEYGEVNASALINYVNNVIVREENMKGYITHNLVDKKDPSKPIKWAKTDSNYKKVLGITQNINREGTYQAKIINVTSKENPGKNYITIQLSRRNQVAFTNELGEQTAHYDAATGAITFTEAGLTPETVIHEFSHPFIDALASNNAELFSNLISDIKADSKIPEIKKIIDHVATNYSTASQEVKDKELLAYVISEYGRGNIDPNTGKNTASAIERFYKWLTSLVKDLVDQMKTDKVLYVNQIHPKTKYKDIADLFTVFSELGTINLGVSPIVETKIAPETITAPSTTKEDILKAKRAARRAAKPTSDSTAAHKTLDSLDAEFVDIKDEAAHMSKLLPKEIAMELVPGYIKLLGGGRRVVGMFQNAMISLSAYGPKGTAYHEGFHAVFRTLLDTKEQDALINEYSKTQVFPTNKELFDLQLEHNISADEAHKVFYEELLADEFAVYMDTPTTVSGKIAAFFKAIKDWFKYVFGNQSAVDALFNNIKKGKYAKHTPNIVKSVAYKVHPTLSVHEVNKITRELASVAFEGINTTEDLKTTKINLQSISDKLIDIQIDAEDNGNDELFDNLTTLFDDNGDLDKFWLSEIDSYMRNSLGLKVKKGKSEKITEEDTDEQNQEDLEKNNFLRSSYEVSGKLNAAATIKFMIAMTPETINTKPEEGLKVENLKFVTSKFTGLPVLVDFGSVYNDLENILANTPTTKDEPDGLQAMLNKLTHHAKYKPELLTIIDRVKNASDEVQTQFFNAFSRQKGSFVHHQVKGAADAEFSNSELTTSNFSTKSTIIRDGWIAEFTKRFGIRQAGQLVYDKETIAKFGRIADKLTANVAQEVASVEAGNHKLSDNIVNQFVLTLNFLGVNVKANTLRYIVESNLSEDSDLDYDVAYAQEFESLVYDFLQATNDLRKREGSILGVNNHIQDNTRFFKNILAEAEAYFKKVPGENAFVGPEGNSMFTFQNNDSVSKAINTIQAGDLTHLENIVTSAYGKSSLWANELLYGDKVGRDTKNTDRGQSSREAFGLHMYGNLRNDETAGDKGAKASDLKPGDAYMDVFNKQMNGYYIGLAEADKSKQTYFKGPKFRKIGFGIKNNAEGNPVSVIQNKEGLAILKGYLADELSRMTIAEAVVYGTDEVKPAPEKDWVIYYHYYPVPAGEGKLGEKSDKIPGNAFNSFLFPNIDLEKLGLRDADGKMIARNAENFDNNKEIEKGITAAFAELVRKEILHAIDLGLISQSKTGELSNRLISTDIIARYKQGNTVYFEQLIGDYVLNSIIGNIEQTKLFNGDPAIYKVKGLDKLGKAIDKSKPAVKGNIFTWNMLDIFGDLKKRIPAVFASGLDFRIFNKQDGTPVVRPYYTSAVIENITVPSSFFGAYDEDGNLTFNKENMDEVQKLTGIPMEELEKLFKPYTEINQTDAQAWITVDTYRERLQGLGKWTPAHQLAYDDIQAGKNLSPIGLKLFAQPLKTVHSELVKTANNEMIMHYNKQSEAVLLPFMKDMQIGRLMQVMESQGVDHVIVLDGKKAGASGIVNIVDDRGQIKDPKEITLNPTRLSYNNLFLQQDLPTKELKDTLVGSQGTKNVLSVVALEEQYLKGTKTGRQLINTFHATLGRLSDLGLISLDKAVGFNKADGKLEDGNAKVRKLIQSEFEGEASENHINALDEDIAFDALPIKNKIMNKLQAIVTKKTVKLKQLGGAFVQLSDLGFVATETKLSDKIKNGIIWFKDPSERLKPMHIKDGEVKAAQILIPHSKFLEMIASNTELIAAMQEKYGVSDYKELTHTQLMTFIPKSVLEGLSYRIPNQGPSSNDAFEVVGVLPREMGDTMVAFSDITTKTGSDFDIDKAFIMMPNFHYDSKTKKLKKTGYDINNIMGERESGLQNLRLDLMREMLMHPAAYASVMAPLDDPWFEDLAKSLFPEQTKLSAMEFFTGRYQLSTKITFDMAKALVGSIANHMTNHSLALADGLYFNDYYLGKGVKFDKSVASTSNKMSQFINKVAPNLIKTGEDKLRLLANITAEGLLTGKDFSVQELIKIGEDSKSGISDRDWLPGTTSEAKKGSMISALTNVIIGEVATNVNTVEEVYKNAVTLVSNMTLVPSNAQNSSISNVKDVEGKSIAGTLGAFMNAIVDAAKDPYVSRANLNQYTAGTTFMLARTGVEREWIVPFIGQPILKDVVAAQAAQEGRFGKPVFDTRRGKRLSAIEIVLAKYGLEVDEKEFRNSEEYKTLREDIDEDITYTVEKLVSNIENPDMADTKFLADQRAILKQFLEWQSKASELNDVIKVSKADVDGATKTLMTAQLAKNLLKKVLRTNYIGNVSSYLGVSLDSTGELNYKQGLEGKMIGRYFENSVEASLKRFSKLFIASSEAAKNLTEKVATWAGYDELITNESVEQLVYTISNEIYAMVATDTKAFRMTPEELHTLLYGKGVASPGSQATLSLASRVEAAKHSELGGNLLIDGLQIRLGRDGAPDKVYLPNTETVKETKEALFQAWSEIFLVDAALAEDLIKYAFYSSGFSKSVGDFSEHIPNDWLKANDFHKDIAAKNLQFEDVYALAEKEDILFKNLYKDNKLVPVVADASISTIIWAKGKELTLDRSMGFMLTQHDSANYTIGEGPHGKVFKRYVKRKFVEKDQQGNIIKTNFFLYKLAGYTYNANAVYIRTNTLGVSGYGNNIKEYNGDGKTSIFPENNVSLPEGLSALVDTLEQRGQAVDDIYDEIQAKTITGSDVEERLAFCIMR